jgi:Na+-transporting methylmalonyl-CoA/oxaloacetate decarboxylase gamma subunit
MNTSKTGMNVVFIIVLLLILLPLALLLLVQFAPPKEAPAQDEAGIAESTENKSAAVRTRQARRENSVAKQETVVIEPEPAPVWEIGAISTDPTRKTKQATPYRPGTVPGDSGVMVQYVGSPDDMVSGPVPPPEDDLWGGRTMPPMTPEQMRGIGGVRRIDPNDPFFQRNIPNPFAN